MKANEALMLSLDNDQNFEYILDEIRRAAKNGKYGYEYCYYNNGDYQKDLTEKRYTQGLQELGYKVLKITTNDDQSFRLSIGW